MSKWKEKYLARALVLSMVLSGGVGMYLAPRAEAIEPIQPTPMPMPDYTVTSAKSTGRFTVDQTNFYKHGPSYSSVVGITGESIQESDPATYYGPFTVTMTDTSGDDGNTITVSDTAADDKDAHAIGVYSPDKYHGITLVGATGAVPIKLKVTATGSTNQAYAYGLYGYNTIGSTEAPIDALIDVKAISAANIAKAFGLEGSNTIYGNGTVTAAATPAADNAEAYGLRKKNIIKGNGTITATAIGGTVTTTDANATTQASSFGLWEANKIGGDGTVTATATGGTATALSMDRIAVADALSNGIFGENVISGKATVRATATGGTAESKNESTDANATAYGTNVFFGVNTISGNADVNVTATGGTATTTSTDDEASANADAYAKTYGLYGENTIGGNATITVTAIGGTATTASTNGDVYADAAANAYGIYKGTTISGNATITVKATGGTASSTSGTVNASASAMGINAFEKNNIIGKDAVITVTALGGIITKVDEAYNYKDTAVGLYALAGTNRIDGNVDITVDASAQTVGAGFAAYSLAAFANVEVSDEVGGNNDLSSLGKLKMLRGDVFATSDTKIQGVNTVVLDTKGSYLQGNIISGKAYIGGSGPYGKNNITISNDAVWRPVYDNRYGTDCVAYDDTDAATKNVATNKVSERSTTYDTTSNSGTTITLNENGIIDLTWDGWDADHKIYNITRDYRTNGSQQANEFRTLTVAKLDGTGGILKVDSDLANNKSDTLTVGSSSTASTLNVQVNYDNFYADSVLGDIVTGAATVVTDKSGNLTVSGMNSEYNAKTFAVTVEKASDYDKTKNWNITKIEDTTPKTPEPTPTPDPDPTPTPTPTPVYSENTKHVADTRNNVNNIWQIETNSLVKRLGDLRSMGKDTSKHDNIWAKYGHGTQKVDSDGRNTEIKYNQFQVGYDKLFDRKDGKMYRGFMVSRINGDATYTRGTGTTNETTLGLYQTWMGNKGHFYDITLRRGKINTDYNVTDLSDNYSTADYSMWATTLSGEYGYRKNLGKGAYIEPSAELILGHVGSADYTTSKGMNSYLEATKHAVTRVGFMTGKEFSKGNAYFKANYYHDFAGGGSVVTDDVTLEGVNVRNWTELGIGGNVQLSKNASAYAEVRKLFGNLKSNVNFSVGARWSF